MINVKNILIKSIAGGILLSQTLYLSPISGNFSFMSQKVLASTEPYCPGGIYEPGTVSQDGSTSPKEYLINGMRVSASSEETINSNEIAKNLLDGNPSTTWCTKWDKSDTGSKYVTLSLKRGTDVNFIKYLPRQNQGLNGVITKYKISVSDDGVNFTEVKTGIWECNESEKTANFDNVKTSFVRLEALESYGGWASGSELSCGSTVGKEHEIRGMKIQASSEETVNSNEIARNLLDNNISTTWCTKWDQSDQSSKYILINLGSQKTFNRVSYIPRPESHGPNGIITRYRISVSNDGVNFTEVKTGDWDFNHNIKLAMFNEVTASYVKLEVLDSHGGWASGSEIRVRNIKFNSFEF